VFDMVTEEGPDGKTVKVKRQMRCNAFVYADEGEVLAATARRNTTSTLLPHLRSIFGGAVLGQANASEERKRRVPAGKYSYGVVIALQPTKAGPLFDDLGVGTPQRILWLPPALALRRRTSDPTGPGRSRAGLSNPDTTPSAGSGWSTASTPTSPPRSKPTATSGTPTAAIHSTNIATWSGSRSPAPSPYSTTATTSTEPDPVLRTRVVW
jgi:hypothetical protein